jgi:hypothetical protein
MRNLLGSMPVPVSLVCVAVQLNRNHARLVHSVAISCRCLHCLSQLAVGLHGIGESSCGNVLGLRAGSAAAADMSDLCTWIDQGALLCSRQAYLLTVA